MRIPKAIVHYLLRPRARRETALVLALTLGYALMISLSGYHRHLNADTAIVYLVSLVRWTPFLWGQNRYGMLIPGLTAWITNPLVNVVVQHALHVTTSLLSFFLMARVFFGRAHYLSTALLALIIYVGLGDTLEIEDFFTPWQIYTPALMFALAGLLALKRNRLAALALLMTAVWCNYSVALVMVLVECAEAGKIWCRAGRARARRDLARSGPVLLVSIAFGAWLRGFGPPDPAGTGGFINPVDALGGFELTLGSYLEQGGGHVALLVSAPLGCIITLVYLRQRSRDVAAGAVRLVGVAFIDTVVVMSHAVARFNGYPTRYLIPGLMMWAVATAGVLVGAAGPRARQSRVSAILAAIFALVIVMRFGWPSPSHVRQGLATAVGERFAEVPAECTHVIGDFYRVWPVAFYSRLVHARPLWAVSYRSSVTADLWDVRRFEAPTLCFWREDESTARQVLLRGEFARFTAERARGPVILVTAPVAPARRE